MLRQSSVGHAQRMASRKAVSRHVGTVAATRVAAHVVTTEARIVEQSVAMAVTMIVVRSVHMNNTRRASCPNSPRRVPEWSHVLGGS